MEWRSRGDLKVVWRSSRHLVCLSQLSRGKAWYPGEEEFSGLSGYSRIQGKARCGSRGSQRASKEDIVTVVLSRSQRLRPESRAPPPHLPPTGSGEDRGSRQESGSLRGMGAVAASSPA